MDIRKWENFKAVYLNFYWLNDSWTRGFKFVTRGFEIVTGKVKLVDLKLHFWISTHAFKLWTRI